MGHDYSMTIAPAVLDELTPASPEESELEALGALIADFEGDGQDENKLTYLKHRYAGFRQRESAILTGIKQSTIKRWIKEDPRVAHFDQLVSTGNRRELRKQVLQEEWFRNYHLVAARDSYILRKVHGMLEEVVDEVRLDGSLKKTTISPPMTKQNWEEYAALRKTYSTEAWKTIESVVKGTDGEFNIHTLILGIGQQQVNVGQ